jgi:protein-S-isoprenylcysteine O-methyltransferase Ste14
MSKVEVPEWSFSWKDLVSSCLLITQILLTFLYYNKLGFDNLANAGWAVMMLSAIFGWVPILTLRRKGKVPKGKSYTQTTALVDTGIYSIVRHPQYIAGVLMSIALVLLSQYWIVAILVLPVSITIYLDSLREDKRLIDKFGENYVEYMGRVPGMNLFRAILQKIIKE